VFYVAEELQAEDEEEEGESQRENLRERERNSRMDTGNEKCMLRIPGPIVM
jgi:hypothetical protein